MKQGILTRSQIAVALLIAMAMAVGFPARVYANPEGGVVAAGSADIHVTPNLVNVHQHSDKAIIDWRSFDIGADETTEFHQPNANSVALNRVHSSQASVINGALKANGNVIVVNQNGVLFGRNARVDVNGLVATTADIDNDKFMTQTNPHFDKPGNPNAAIINQGQITAKDSGLVGFVAPRVENDGIITARLGRVHLAAGDKATIDFYGDGLMEVAVSDDVRQQLVKNTGSIHADGGLVALTAAAGNRILASAIEVGGDVRAQTVAQQGGRIIISGMGGNAVAGNVAANKSTATISTVTVKGSLNASGTQVGQKGGAITVTGDKVQLASTAKLNASGHRGGGDIKIGGDFYGKGTTPTANLLLVDRGASILNNALYTGNGGATALWSDGATQFAGSISNRGGQFGGNGGFVEVSGKKFLAYQGLVDTRAPRGLTGTLLLDPADITISNLADSNISGATPFGSTGAAVSNLNVGTLVGALGTSNVTITTASGVGGNGDITFVDPVAWNSGFSLTATADRHIFVNAAITNGGTGNIVLNATTAGSNITIAAPISTGGTLAMTAAQDLVVNAALTAGGAMNLTATGRDLLTYASAILNATGSITTISGRDTSFGANATSGGNVIVTAARDLTVGAAATLTTGPTSSMNLQAAGGNVSGTGNLNMLGNLSVGSGPLTLVSGINGTRPNLTLTGTNLLRQGATFGSIDFRGFLNLVIGRDINSSSTVSMNGNPTGGSITVSSTGAVSGTSLSFNSNLDTTINGAVNASTTLNISTSQDIIIGATGSTNSTGISTFSSVRDWLINGTVTTAASITENVTRDILMGATGSINSTGALTFTGRDIALGNVTSGSNISATATRNLTTLASTTITNGATSTLSLYAANNVVTGTGNLTLNGILNTGSGGLNLTSGVNGTRPNWTMTSTNLLRQGATFGAITITGFLDTFINRDLNSNGNISIRSFRDLTLGATYTLTPASAGNLVLAAANNTVTGTGNLYLNGILNAGTGTTSLLSGINGTRTNYTLTGTNFLRQGGTWGGIIINGFNDTIVDTDVNSNSTISINSYRDITVNALRTLTSGAAGGLTLTAANNLATGTGNLNLNGVLRNGTGALTLTSGANGTRPNLTMDGTNIQRTGAAYGTIIINGFLDTFINDNVISNSSITINSFRDLTLNAANTVTTGTAGSLTLRAANLVVTGTGHLILNGNLSVGNGGLTLLSGVQGAARQNYTATTTSLVRNNTNFGAVNINGFQDTTIDSNMTSTGAITINSYRDLTISAGRTVTTSATGALVLTAANSLIAGTGNLYLNGNIGAGSGGLTLLSGVNVTRPDWTASTTTLLQPGASFGIVSIQGLRDMTIDRNITGTTGVTLLSYRDLTINAGSTVTSAANGALSIRSAGGVVAGTGRLTINGNIGAGSSSLTLLSGINGTRPTFTANATTLLRPGTNFGTINIQGFEDFIVDRPLNSSSTVTFSNNTRTTLSDDITGTSAGTINFSNPVVIAEGTTANVTSTNAAITFGSTVDDTIGGAADNLVVNSGTATTFFNGAVNGIGLTVNASTLTIAPTSLGATRALQNVALTTTNGFSTPSITASQILLRTTGATADLTIAAGRVLTASSAGDAIVLAARRNFINNNGTGALVRTGGGRFITYSTTPGSDTSGGLTYDHRRFSCSFATAGTCAFNATIGATVAVPASGNVFLYSSTPILLAVMPQAIANIVYGSAVPNLTNYAYVPFTLASGYVNASDFANDVISGSINGQTNYTQGSNVGSYNISYLSGDLVSSLGYGFNYQTLTNAFTVTARHVSVDLAGIASKIYDGNNTATLSNTNYTINNIYAGDLLTLGVANTGATYNDKNVGTGKTLTANGLSLTGVPASNYILDNTSAIAGVGTITPRALNVTGIAPNRVYDATVNSSATLSDNRVGGDVLNLAYGTATFDNKNVGTGKTVTVNGIAVTGADAGNYSFNTSTTTTANITPAVLTVGAAGINKIYNGDATATVTLTDNRFGGDVLNLAYGSALFPDKNAGTGLTVNVSGLDVTGADAGNYTFNTTTSTTANIIPRVLTIGGTGVNRIYDGTNIGTVILNDDRLGGDSLTTGYTSALFDNKNVGNGKTMTVAGLTLMGADAGNYSFNTGFSTTADITPRALTIGATGINKIYDGSANAGVTISDNRIGGDILNITYGSALFPDKNVGNGRTINVSGLSLAGADAGNYSFNTSATTSADITQRALLVSASGINKIYDGNALAGVTIGDDRVGGDVLTITYGSALFPDKNAGNGRTITVSGINVTGADVGNYSFNTSTTTTADITPRALLVSASGINKVYDGSANAGVTIGDNRLGGDVLNITYGSALFPNKNVGNGRTITVSGISLAGADAGNYAVNTSATTTADITPRVLLVSASGINKTYDGNDIASVLLNHDGVVGDAISLTYGSALFPDKNVGVNRLVAVDGIALSGADANNYIAPMTTATTTASINQRALIITVIAQNKQEDGSSAATVALSDDRVAGDIFVVGYGSATFPDASFGFNRVVTVDGINLTGADSGNYSFAPTVYATASIFPVNLPPSALITPNTVVKVSQNTASVFLTMTEDGINATPSTGYNLVYLPDDAPGDNKKRNKPIRAGIGVPIIEPSAFYGEIEEI